jgi:predicted RNase H-like HicB family nuclease
MTHYVAIVEDSGPEKAVGIWFPDLPGCFSAGDDIDEALRNAPQAMLLYAKSLKGRQDTAGAPIHLRLENRSGCRRGHSRPRRCTRSSA